MSRAQRFARMWHIESSYRVRFVVPGVFALATVLLVTPIVPQAVALNIVLVYNNASSVEPASDPTGALLTALFQHAESSYQDIFEDAHTLTVNFWWEDLDPISTGTLGVHTLVSQGGVPNRETEANIRIDNDRSWFFDSTPTDDSEFTMSQTLWRDLTAGQQSDLYNNFGVNIPDTFEAGYTGAAVPGGVADLLFDTLSVVLHEVGHALGMSAANNSTIAETGDGDYDFDTDFVFGQTLAAEIADGNDIAHLDGSGFTLMQPSVGTSFRRRPSHTDLFSMASGHAYVDLDVPRREWYAGGTSDWNTDANWSGNTVPGSADDTFVRNNGAGGIITASLSANGFTADLFVGEAANVDTNANTLTVFGTATVDGLDTDIIIDAGGELDADDVQIQNQAEIFMPGGLLDTDTMTIDEGAQIRSGAGAATVDVQTNLLNNGTIVAGSGGITLTTTNVGGVFNLDGFFFNGFFFDEDGILDVTSGNMVVDGQLTDDFNGTANVGNGTSTARTLTFNDGWTVGAPDLLILDAGDLNLNGNATVAGGAMIVDANITASDSDATTADIAHLTSSSITFNSPANVTVNNAAVLEVDGPAVFNGGTYTVLGTGQLEFEGGSTFNASSLGVTGIVQQNSDATVLGDTVITGERFDMDGDPGASIDWTIGLGADLQLNVDSIESTGAGGTFHGTITVNSNIAFPASLTIDITGGTQWTMAGTLTTNGPDDPFILNTIGAGTDFNLTGTANVNGNNAWQARVDVSGTITTVDAEATIRLTGGSIADPNRLIGGTITGPGTLSATTNDALFGNGTIDTDISYLNDAELRADDGTMTVNGTILDVGTIGTAHSDGILNVTNPWNTSVANQLELLGGEVTGSQITNDGTTVGFGDVSAPFVNNNVTSAEGGTLVLSAAAVDLDGGTETGTLNAVDGDLRVSNTGFFGFNGTVNIGAGRMYSGDIGGLAIQANGTVNMTNGRYEAPQFRNSTGGTLNVNAGGESQIAAPTSLDFWNGSTSNINDDLRLIGDATVEAGAVFSGTGRVIVDGASTLTLFDGANVGVTVRNEGLTRPGASPACASVDEFTQTPAGTYEAEIFGLVACDRYDQLTVDSDAKLAGTLDVLPEAPYSDPAVMGTVDKFVLLAASALNGSFDTVVYDGGVLVPTFGPTGDGSFRTHVADGLFRLIDYASGTNMRLLNYKALGGDANGDGFVDGIDFNTWNAHKFGPGDWLDGDFDNNGFVDGADFAIWNLHKFTGVDLSIPPVPEPSSLSLVLIGFLVLWGVRRPAG